MRGTNPLRTQPVTLSATIALYQAVTVAGAAATAGATIFGVAQVAGVSGAVVPVVTAGTTLMVAGGTITAGAFVQVHSTVTQVVNNASTGRAIGRALHAAVSGDFVEIELTPQAVNTA